MAGIATEVDGPVGWLVLDNPTRRNAMTQAMYEAVPPAVDALVGADGVRLIVVRGAGPGAFGAGSDISEFPTQRTRDTWRVYARVEHQAQESLRSAPVPTIAMIHGPCRGGGLAMALCADLRYAARTASFSVPPARLGVGYPRDGYEAVVAAVGIARAKDLVLTARVLDGAEAADIGLVHAVMADAELEPTVMAIAHEIARLAPLTLRSAKLVLDDLARPPADRDPSAAEDSITACYESEDYAEGVAAFLEKRPPRFVGR